MLSIERLAVKAPAIIEAFYPAMRGAEAIFLHVFGLANRWGRLPVTVYPSSFAESVSMYDFNMTVGGVGRTYRYYTQPPVFAFGSGLSYSRMNVSCHSPGPDASWSFLCRVSNTDAGAVSGDVVIQVYHRASAAIRQEVDHPVPWRSLRDFDRAFVSAGESTVMLVEVPLEWLALTNRAGELVVYAGTHFVEITDGNEQIASFELQVKESKVLESMPESMVWPWAN